MFACFSRKHVRNHIQPHVCILSCQHAPDDVRVTHKVARSLRNAGLRVSWVGPAPTKGNTSLDGIDFHFYRRLSGRAGRLFHCIPTTLAAAAVRDVDLYYAVEPDSAVVGLVLARL